MKSKIFLTLFIIFNLSINILSAQNDTLIAYKNDNSLIIQENDANNPCISEEQYKLIEKRCEENIKFFHFNDERKKETSSVSLSWPVKAASGFNDCSFYYISAHVDHDSTASFKDYNCGTISYNGHHGTDIATGPFPFYKMDNSQVEIIAAAAGTILDKHDGEFDRNCLSAGSNVPANYVIIQHSDGSRALYWHMKSGSVTTKAIGQSVILGEYLGQVGSSGSSGGPHLHFEIWAGNTSGTYIDPFAGTCNLINSTSWWAVQKPYTEPSIIKASVHTTDITFPPCGTTETTNESTSYTIPFQGLGLSPGYAKFYIFIRNQTSGTSANMSILNPNSSVFSSWSYNFSSTYKFSYASFSKLLPTSPGTYTFQAMYNGITCSQNFEILAATEVSETDNIIKKVDFFPNPFISFMTIHLKQAITNGELNIYNELGQNIKKMKNISGREIKFYRDNIACGIYYIRLTQYEEVIMSEKLIIIDK